MKIHRGVRAWLIQHPWVATCVFAMMTVGFVYTNAFVEKGGVMDEALTDPNNPDYTMDVELRERFPSSQKLAFVYRDHIDSVDDLRAILEMSERLEEFDWASGRVLSLATAPDFDATDDELSDETLDTVSGGLKYKLDRCFVKSWSTSGDADDRPTEEVAFYYNKLAG